MAILSPFLRELRLRAAGDYVHGDVLDLGCGTAEILERYRGQLASYTGTERSQRHVDALRVLYPDQTFTRCDLDEDPLWVEGRQFDVILALAVIEHIYNQKHFMKEIIKVLKPEGRLVMTTPTPFGNDIVHRFGAWLGLFSREAAQDHVTVFNRRRFAILAREFGLEIEHYKRFEFGCNQLVVMRRREPRPAAAPQVIPDK